MNQNKRGISGPSIIPHCVLRYMIHSIFFSLSFRQTFIHIEKHKQKAQIEISENMIVGDFNFPFLTDQVHKHKGRNKKILLK